MISRRSGAQSGLALITTLLVTAILVTVVTEFAYRMYISTARAGNYRDSARASLLAVDGVAFARAGLSEMLKRDSNLVINEGGLVFTKPAGAGLSVEIRIIDEKGKLSARVAYPKTGFLDSRTEKGFRGLLKNLKLDEHLIDTLADWIDNDSDTRHFGAEEHDYKALKNPYKPGNNYPATNEELLLVKGYTPKVFRALAPFVSVYTDGLVNINTAPKQVLTALSEDITEAMADEVIRYRNSSPFKDRSEVMKVRGFEKAGFALQDRITTTSNLFRVYSRATAGEAVYEVEALVQVNGGVLYWREL